MNCSGPKLLSKFETRIHLYPDLYVYHKWSQDRQQDICVVKWTGQNRVLRSETSKDTLAFSTRLCGKMKLEKDGDGTEVAWIQLDLCHAQLWKIKEFERNSSFNFIFVKNITDLFFLKK